MAQPEVVHSPTQPETQGDVPASSETSSSDSPTRAPSTEGASPPRPGPSRWSVAAIVLLVIVLLWTGINLRGEIRARQALEAHVGVLESEVARAQASVEAYETRLEVVRDEVGDLVSRVGTLNRLVTSEVMADDALRVPLAPPEDAESLSGD